MVHLIALNFYRFFLHSGINEISNSSRILRITHQTCKEFLHVHGVQIHRVIELTTVHAHSIASQVNAHHVQK